MNFIKIRKPLKNLNEVFKHTEMPQKCYGNASKKEETRTPQQNKVLKVFSKYFIFFKYLSQMFNSNFKLEHILVYSKSKL